MKLSQRIQQLSMQLYLSLVGSIAHLLPSSKDFLSKDLYHALVTCSGLCKSLVQSKFPIQRQKKRSRNVSSNRRRIGRCQPFKSQVYTFQRIQRGGSWARIFIYPYAAIRNRARADRTTVLRPPRHEKRRREGTPYY